MAQLYKIVVLGDQAVGKTALVARFTENYFVDEYTPTFKDRFRKNIIIDQMPCTVEIQDTAGCNDDWMKYQRTDSSEGLVFVYNICRKSSFTLIQSIIETTELPAPILLLGNMMDKSPAREVTKSEGLELASRCGATFFETSAKDGTGIAQAFGDLLNHMDKIHSLITRHVPPLMEPKHVALVTDNIAYVPTSGREVKDGKVHQTDIDGLRSGFDEQEVSMLFNIWHSLWMCVGRRNR